jgi:hypothetical protein
MDPAVDFFDSSPRSQEQDQNYFQQMTYFKKFDRHRLMTNEEARRKVDQSQVADFAEALLNECLKYAPTWLSVPQRPMVSDKSRNNINRALAAATSKWKTQQSYKGKLILPVLLTHQKQVVSKTLRNNITSLAVDSYHAAAADGVWIADSSLDDQKGSSSLAEKRFPKLAELHGELIEALPSTAIVVAGPYWGINLVLWSRGLATHPAIGMGRGYRYYLSGGFQRRSTAKVAIPPLRRLASVKGLATWLEEAMSDIEIGHPAYKAFDQLLKRIVFYSDSDKSRQQTAEFYKIWLDILERVPSAGRALALYQDLSNAYVIGRLIHRALPQADGPASRPERIAQQFMLNCL